MRSRVTCRRIRSSERGNQTSCLVSTLEVLLTNWETLSVVIKMGYMD